MSDVLDEIIFPDEEVHPPFFVPFALTCLWILPASLLAFWAGPRFVFSAHYEPAGGAVMFFMSMGLCIVLAGILAGLGGRFSRADLFPTYAALTLHLVLVLATIAIETNFIGAPVSIIHMGWDVLRTDLASFARDLVTLGGKLLLSYPAAYYIAYRIADPE